MLLFSTIIIVVLCIFPRKRTYQTPRLLVAVKESHELLETKLLLVDVVVHKELLDVECQLENILYYIEYNRFLHTPAAVGISSHSHKSIHKIGILRLLFFILLLFLDNRIQFARQM